MVKTYYPKEINLFLEEVTHEIKNSLDPDFIILAGSFGKEAWLYSEDSLLSDFEIVFVTNKNWSLKRKKNLLKKLNSKYPYEINLKGFLRSKIEEKIISSYSMANPGYVSLEFFDTFNNPCIIYSKTKEKLLIDCDSSEIPIWEAWRLYANRIADLLKIKTVDISATERGYYYLKILESTADAYLIVNGMYDKNISKRIKLFSKKSILNDKELPNNCKESYPIICEALKSRESHQMNSFPNLKIGDLEKKVISWMSYFEEKMALKEDIPYNSWENFYKNYSVNIFVQQKYSEMNYKMNNLVSNIIRLIYNRELLNKNFRFYSLINSWQHLSLISIVCYFREQACEMDKFPLTKEIYSKLLRSTYVKNQSNSNLKADVLKYWKYLR